MTDPTPDAEPLRIPIGRNVTYAVRGLPAVPNAYGPGHLLPREVSLTYRAWEDSQLRRFHAYVKGEWVRDGEVISSGEKLPGQHYNGDPANWPAGLAEEARLHDPDAATVPASAPAEQTAPPSTFVLWLDASDGSVPTHDGIVWPDGATTVHHRNSGLTATHASLELAQQFTHGKQSRIVWPAPTDRAALSARLWAVAEHNIVAEWICCEPINPEHDLCVQGDATRRMVKALLVDDPEAIRPAPLLDAVLAVLPAPADRAAVLREATEQSNQTTPNTEPVNCGLCLYGSDVGVPGYDDRGPAYTNPACPDHAPETAPGVCTCGHTDRAAALTDREEAMLSFALEMAQEEIHARSLELADDDQAALAGLRRLADAASGPGRADGEPQQDGKQAAGGVR